MERNHRSRPGDGMPVGYDDRMADVAKLHGYRVVSAN
jgi:hypothetical protein